MYLWLSINVDNYFQELKKKVANAMDEIGFRYGTNGLPYHISLKISFEAPLGKKEEIINSVEEFYKTLKPFVVKTKGIEEAFNILWIRYIDNEYLDYIGKELNKMLNEKHNIPYHKFDIDYIFHTTLFMNENQDIISEGYKLLHNEFLPKDLYINKFLIGFSKEGKPETYQVMKEIEVF